MFQFETVPITTGSGSDGSVSIFSGSLLFPFFFQLLKAQVSVQPVRFERTVLPAPVQNDSVFRFPVRFMGFLLANV